MRARVLSGAVILAAILFAATDAQSPQAQADATHGKLMKVIEAGQSSKDTGRRTVLTEAEMNAYLQYRAQSWLPTGITNPRLDFIGGNRVAIFVVADLDNVRRKSSGGWFDPTAYLSGRLPVQATGTLTTERRPGQVRSRTGDGRRHPGAAVVHRRAAGATTPARRRSPTACRLDEPFILPAAIDRIDIRADQATVVQ